MKKLVILLCLCMCLNGVAVAEEGVPASEGEAVPVEEAAQPEATESETQAEEPQEVKPQEVKSQEAKSQEAPSSDAGQSGANDARQSGGDTRDETADNGTTDNAGDNKDTGSENVGGDTDGATDSSATDSGTDDGANGGASDNNAVDGSSSDGATDDKATGEGGDEETDRVNDNTNTDAETNDGAADGASDNKGAESDGNNGTADGEEEGSGSGNPDDADNAGDPTVAPEPTETPEPTEAPEPTENPEERDIPEGLKIVERGSIDSTSFEAWFEWESEDYACGTLEKVLKAVAGQEKVVTLSVEKLKNDTEVENVAVVPDAPLKQLSDVTLKISDSGSEYKVINISLQNPKAEKGPVFESFKALIKEPENNKIETADLYIWLSKPETDDAGDNSGDDPAEAPEPTPAPELAVSVAGATGAEWSSEPPVFTLSGIPEGKPWSYAAVIYDERFVPLSGDTYTPAEEGVYTVRLVMLDELGDIVSASDKYTLWLDWTEPEGVTVRLDTEVSYTAYFSSTDAISGVAAISLDGGGTWSELADGEEFRYTASGPRTFAAGEILVRDAAGNICPCEQEVELKKIEPENNGYYGGGGGGGGSSGDGKPAKTHASGDGEDTGEYEALRLELPEEPMRQLTVDGEAMALTLVLEEAQESGAPVGQQRLFSAEWAAWGPGEADREPDTLVLSAELDDNLGDSFTYAWHFNGEVYRMLANSGIKYVALRVGDDLAAFPTEGFTGGTKYTELKMLGVSTRRFDYTLTMKVNLDPAHVSALTDSDFSQDCDLSIRTEVENMSYELSSSPQSIMYFYDVYLGPEDMLNQPFGQYRVEAQ